MVEWESAEDDEYEAADRPETDRVCNLIICV